MRTGGGRRVNHLQYRATGNTTARNNAGFDMGSTQLLYRLDTTKRCITTSCSAIFVFGLLQAAHAPVSTLANWGSLSKSPANLLVDNLMHSRGASVRD